MESASNLKLGLSNQLNLLYIFSGCCVAEISAGSMLARCKTLPFPPSFLFPLSFFSDLFLSNKLAFWCCNVQIS